MTLSQPTYRAPLSLNATTNSATDKKPSQSINIIASTVNETNLPGTYRDTKLTGFRLKVTAQGTKIFIVYGKVKGQRNAITVTIGRHPGWSAVKARDEAERIIREMRCGINPNEANRQKQKASEQKKKEEDVKLNVTLRRVFREYMAVRELKATTIKGYTVQINSSLKDWLDTPLIEITKDMVEVRHKEISQAHKGDADLTFRVFRLLYNYAIIKYEDVDGKPLLKDNPVSRLRQLKAWNKLPRRKSIIKQSQLKDWFAAVKSLESGTARAFFITLLLTGARESEVKRLQWADVDFDNRTLYFRDTKNHRNHLIPLPNYLSSALSELPQSGPYVFPGPVATMHIKDLRHQVKLVCEKAGFKFMLHDCRRTFTTIASHICTQYQLKELINHKDASDVTLGYVVADVKSLAMPMQNIELEILRLAEINLKADE